MSGIDSDSSNSIQETTSSTKLGAKAEVKDKATRPNKLYSVYSHIDTPEGGASNLTFPIQIDAGQQRVKSTDLGTYFAQAFSVSGKDGQQASAYIALQPRGDGKALVAFSGFGDSISTRTGYNSADGGAGGSNSSMVDFKFGDKYNLTVERNPDNPKELNGYIQNVTDPNNPGEKNTRWKPGGKGRYWISARRLERVY